MTILVNSEPLRAKYRDSDENVTIEDLENFLPISYSSSTGIVICYTEGTGEVLTQETFDDTGLHFIFSKSTSVIFMPDHSELGVGSVVRVYWSRSFERVVRGSHIVVQVEKMEVFKCCTFLKTNVFVTYNSQSLAGVAIGVTEKNMMVAFHPNCFPETRYETLKAHNEARTEFKLSTKHKNRENTNRMVQVILASAPFKIELSGSIEKIPFFVIKKYDDLEGFEGAAVITKIVKNFFMEATFLSNGEFVFFEPSACHSNILEKLSVGSLISVQASPTFPSSCFKWYGYDVTMCYNIHQLEELQSGRDYVFDEEAHQKMLQTPIFAESKTLAPIKKDAIVEKMEVKKRLTSFHLPTLTKTAQFKHTHTIFDCSTSEIPEIDLKIGLEARNFSPEFPEKSGKFPNYRNVDEKLPKNVPKCSESTEERIWQALESFGLQKSKKRPIFQNPLGNSPKPPTEKKPEKPKISAEKLRILADSEGFAIGQTVPHVFCLPDSDWRPTERRFIGVHDDLQWVLMATFCQKKQKTDETRREGPLDGGFWYRRTVPREAPVKIIKEMNCRRNIFEDCQLEM